MPVWSAGFSHAIVMLFASKARAGTRTSVGGAGRFSDAAALEPPAAASTSEHSAVIAIVLQRIFSLSFPLLFVPPPSRGRWVGHDPVGAARTSCLSSPPPAAGAATSPARGEGTWLLSASPGSGAPSRTQSRCPGRGRGPSGWGRTPPRRWRRPACAATDAPRRSRGPGAADRVRRTRRAPPSRPAPAACRRRRRAAPGASRTRSEEHTSELQSPCNLVCRLLLEKKKKKHHSLAQKKKKRRCQ